MSMSMPSTMHFFLEELVREKVPVTVKLRGDLALVQGVGGIGPGVLEYVPVDVAGEPGRMVKMTCAGQAQKPGTSPPQLMSIEMDFIFDASDVLWVQPAPRMVDAPSIVTAS